jgi:gas vesicle protein
LDLRKLRDGTTRVKAAKEKYASSLRLAEKKGEAMAKLYKSILDTSASTSLSTANISEISSQAQEIKMDMQNHAQKVKELKLVCDRLQSEETAGEYIIMKMEVHNSLFGRGGNSDRIEEPSGDANAASKNLVDWLRARTEELSETLNTLQTSVDDFMNESGENPDASMKKLLYALTVEISYLKLRAEQEECLQEFKEEIDECCFSVEGPMTDDNTHCETQAKPGRK